MTAPDKQTGSPRSDEVIASEYVMGTLSREDRRAVERRLARDRRFAATVRRWESSLADLAEEEQPLSMSAVSLQLVQPAPGDAVLSGRVSGGYWNSLALWRAFGCAALAVATGLAVAALFPPAPERGRARATLTGDGQALGIAARYDRANGLIRLAPAVGREAAGVLRLWIVENGKPAVSLGILPGAGEGALAVPAGLRDRLVPGAVLAVSIEPPGAKANSPLVASGALHFE